MSLYGTDKNVWESSWDWSSQIYVGIDFIFHLLQISCYWVQGCLKFCPFGMVSLPYFHAISSLFIASEGAGTVSVEGTDWEGQGISHMTSSSWLV